MASVRVTVSFAEGVPTEEHPARLATLAADLHSALQDGEHLTRSSGLSLPGAPTEPGGVGSGADRIFTLELPDGVTAGPFLRALGGWLMRTPAASVAVRAEGPSGGVSLRLSEWSAVAFAATAARIHGQLAPAGPTP